MMMSFKAYITPPFFDFFYFKALCLSAFDTLHAALPFFSSLALLLSLPLTLADTAGHKVAGFPKAWHNGLPLAAAFLTVNEPI